MINTIFSFFLLINFQAWPSDYTNLYKAQSLQFNQSNKEVSFSLVLFHPSNGIMLPYFLPQKIYIPLSLAAINSPN